MREFFTDEYAALDEAARLSLAATLAEIEKICFSDPWSATAFSEAFDNRVIKLFTLYEDKTLVGYALYALIAPEAELLNLAILPTYRRKGLAAALLDYADAYLEEHDVSDVYLEVRRSNIAAQALYLARGFREVGIRRAYYRFPTEDAILMALSLT